MTEEVANRKRVIEKDSGLSQCRLMIIHKRIVNDNANAFHTEYFYIDRKYIYHKLSIVLDIEENRYFIKDTYCEPTIGWLDFKAEIVWGLNCNATLEDCMRFLDMQIGRVFEKQTFNVRG